MRDRAPLLLLAGVAALGFAPALAFQRVYFFGDAIDYALRLAYTADQLRRGHLPLWNPFLSLGAPHAADPVPLVFYPPHVLLALVFGVRVYAFDAALHAVLAAFATFALGRSWGLTRAAALLAAVAYSLCGFAAGHLQHLNILVAMAWVPVVFACVERYLSTSDRRALACSMLATGLFILGGHSQIVLYGLSALAAYAAFRLASLWRGGEAHRLPGLIAGLGALVVVGSALAAVFLLPFWEWMRFVSRAERVTRDYATWYSLPPIRLAGLVAPFWLGGSPGRPHNVRLLIEWSLYLGLLPLALAPVALARRNGLVWFLSGLALLAILLALGKHTRLYAPLLDAPLFASVRAPARFLALASFALALLAGFGLDALRSGAGRFLARLEALVLLALLVVVARAAWLGHRVVLSLHHADRVRFGQTDTLVLLAALAGGSAMLWTLASPWGSGRAMLALALVFTAGDLLAYRAQLFFNGSAPPDAYEEASATALAIQRDGGPARFFTLMGKEVEDLVMDRRDFEGYRRQMWESLRGSLSMRFGLQSLSGHLAEPRSHGRLVSFLKARESFDSRAARVAGVFGVRYLISSPSWTVTAPEMTALPGVEGLYRNEAAMPRVYVTPGARAAESDREALDVVIAGDLDPRLAVVVESPTPLAPAGAPAKGSASIIVDEPDRVVVQTASERAAWLVLNDTFAPGWTAIIDGRPAPLLRANGLVRTVFVDAGSHQVEFLYAPASVRRGAMGSVAGLLVGGGLLLARGRRAAPDRRGAGPGAGGLPRSGLSL